MIYYAGTLSDTLFSEKLSKIYIYIFLYQYYTPERITISLHLLGLYTSRKALTFHLGRNVGLYVNFLRNVFCAVIWILFNVYYTFELMFVSATSSTRH